MAERDGGVPQFGPVDGGERDRFGGPDAGRPNRRVQPEHLVPDRLAARGPAGGRRPAQLDTGGGRFGPHPGAPGRVRVGLGDPDQLQQGPPVGPVQPGRAQAAAHRRDPLAAPGGGRSLAQQPVPAREFAPVMVAHRVQHLVAAGRAGQPCQQRARLVQPAVRPDVPQPLGGRPVHPRPGRGRRGQFGRLRRMHPEPAQRLLGRSALRVGEFGEPVERQAAQRHRVQLQGQGGAAQQGEHRRGPGIRRLPPVGGEFGQVAGVGAAPAVAAHREPQAVQHPELRRRVDPPRWQQRPRRMGHPERRQPALPAREVPDGRYHRKERRCAVHQCPRCQRDPPHEEGRTAGGRADRGNHLSRPVQLLSADDGSSRENLRTRAGSRPGGSRGRRSPGPIRGPPRRVGPGRGRAARSSPGGCGASPSPG